MTTTKRTFQEIINAELACGLCGSSEHVGQSSSRRNADPDVIAEEWTGSRLSSISIEADSLIPFFPLSR